ncbi:FMN-dependent NADH-azoreductase [Amycolatopsis sp. FDAARGOS 1241]|uniref:FMN-dependent NADH-azoreductase n=1 Tax=Amycolatopsis sp. FDAARGOS 1241 TaxID=2778070 RepID=UPI001EF17BD2|nr:NAD(P)H-dependent oxidoreductase [Amycolatopsis sp. FDAARGOS 1241]
MTDMLAPLLRIDSSADGEESVTRRLTSLFAKHWPGEVRHRDLAADPVPPISEAYARLGRRVERRGSVPLPEITALAADDAERREWELTLPFVTEVREAGAVLLGVPMYNFSVPAALKAWIDRLTFPGAFADALRDTRFVVVCARGGAYGPGTPREGCDFQEPYLRTYLTNLGVAQEHLTFVVAELTRVADIPALAGLEHLAEESFAAAERRVLELVA